MPTFFPDGRILAGATIGGSEPPSINNELIPQIGAIPVSVPRPLDNNRIIYSQANGVKILDLTQPASSTNPQIIFPEEANWVEGRGNVWALRRQSRVPTYLDSFGNNLREYRPLAVTPELGVIAKNYSLGQGLYLFHESGSTAIDFTLNVYDNDADAHGRFWVMRSSETSMVAGEMDTVLRRFQVPASVDLAFYPPYILVNLLTEQVALLNLLNDTYAVLPLHSTRAFHADLRVAGDTAYVAFSTTNGERVGTNQVETYSLSSLSWQPFFGPAPVPVPPPVPNPNVDLRPHPRPLWLAPYHQITDRWGDSPDALGNALLILPESPEESIETYHARIRRGASRGKPLILTPEGFNREWESLVVAWYFHEPTRDAMIDKLNRFASLVWPQPALDKPVIAYIDDSDAWQSEIRLPTTITIWPSPQFYRNQGESLSDFDARCQSTLNELTNHGHYGIVPTIGAFDRNGEVPVEEMVEAFRLFHNYPRLYQIVGYLPFTDMRQGAGVGGMNLHPSLKAAVSDLVRMNPEDRPNRFSYWVPSHSSQSNILNNILSQSRELVALSPMQKGILLDLLNIDSQPIDTSQMRAVVMGDVGNVPRPTPNGGRAFLEACIRALGDPRWGLHQRPNGRISTDILALNTTPYRIFDVIFAQESEEARAIWQEVEPHEIEEGSHFVSVL